MSSAVNNSLISVLTRPDCFTAGECEQIIELGIHMRKLSGIARGQYADIRDSRVCFISPGHDTNWIFAKLHALVMAANQQYRCHLSGFREPLQFAEYESGGHYGWHVDVGSDITSGRKISASVQLSDGSSYEGGDLEFVNINIPEDARSIDSITLFPSYLAHRVAPVTKGIRRSLVAWVHGNPFT
jgi:PKHD-type hydroxylase